MGTLALRVAGARKTYHRGHTKAVCKRSGNGVRSCKSHPWPNNPLELTAHSAGFLGGS